MRVGIDLGGTNIAVGLVENGTIVCKASVKTDSRDVGKIICDMADIIKSLCEKNGIEPEYIESIGIGAPGTPDKENTAVSNVFNITESKIEFGKELGKYFDRSIYIENDARCAALGELLYGAAKGYKNVVMITLGTGIGSGIIINGRLYGGSNYAAGEVGHMKICMNGEKCKCGEYGCYEQYASASALVRIAENMIENSKDGQMHKLLRGGCELDGKFIFECAHKNIPTALRILEVYTENVAVGLVNIVNIFQPELIVVGGGISAQGDFLLNPIREYVGRHVFTKNMPVASIVSAQLGNDAGIIGAAMLDC